VREKKEGMVRRNHLHPPLSGSILNRDKKEEERKKKKKELLSERGQKGFEK